MDTYDHANRQAWSDLRSAMFSANLDEPAVATAIARGELPVACLIVGTIQKIDQGNAAERAANLADLEQEIVEYIETSQGRAAMVQTLHAILGRALARAPRH
ncbi:hypothetical protein [Oceaniglobus trochenteri]|uniref:hypothetical protein n=1 Tax=Oceaniglobus trochenteri TaxID=2763260 RepID=UPI001CFFABF3|nr:hypothetical protein [Oceaniglobus trochenteri]